MENEGPIQIIGQCAALRNLAASGDDEGGGEMSDEIIKGTKSICKFIGISKSTYHRWLKQGLPVRYINGRSAGIQSELVSYVIVRDEKRKNIKMNTL